jgi:hypothetical protein
VASAVASAHREEAAAVAEDVYPGQRLRIQTSTGSRSAAKSRKSVIYSPLSVTIHATVGEILDILRPLDEKIFREVAKTVDIEKQEGSRK